ncbi:response regulator [Oerskovia sp. NPDC060287]|uniref:response regulator n=1 Tax=Oerskovia sp. NPDC060287 TaxID=3347095 RepID=UPI00365742AB
MNRTPHAPSPDPGPRRRVGIVDDHAAVGLGVEAILDQHDDLALVARAATVSELVDAAQDLDLVLLDLRLADRTTPAQNLERLRRLGVTVVAYTSGDDPALVRQAARSGVAGMIRKSESPATLVDALRAAARGEIVASVDWAAAIDADAAVQDAGLTARESQVLELYASGEKADRVARMLGITRETVLDHVRRIRTKYAAVDRQAHTKVDLYRRAVEDGMLAPPR